MKIAMIIVRSLMGLMFLFASISYFVMKNPPAPQGDVKTYMAGISLVHIMTIVKVLELLCGLCFITGRYVTLAAVVLFPIIINIVLFHAFLEPKELPVMIVLLLGNLFLAYYYRRNYITLFAAR